MARAMRAWGGGGSPPRHVGAIRIAHEVVEGTHPTMLPPGSTCDSYTSPIAVSWELYPAGCGIMTFMAVSGGLTTGSPWVEGFLAHLGALSA